MAAVTRSVIRSFDQDFTQPARLLEKVARRMSDDLDRLEMFVTVAVGVIDVPSGVIRIANAGHCLVAVATNGTLTEAGPDNPPVGIERAPTYPEHVIPLTPGTHLLAFTDGLVDPRGGRPRFESESEVAAWLASSDVTGVSALKSSLLERLGYHATAAPLADDQTFLLLSRD
jgi:sigma-B regulation protein RsbU (phosphoserine phosphatase)